MNFVHLFWKIFEKELVVCEEVKKKTRGTGFDRFGSVFTWFLLMKNEKRNWFSLSIDRLKWNEVVKTGDIENGREGISMFDQVKLYLLIWCANKEKIGGFFSRIVQQMSKWEMMKINRNREQFCSILE